MFHCLYDVYCLTYFGITSLHFHGLDAGGVVAFVLRFILRSSFLFLGVQEVEHPVDGLRLLPSIEAVASLILFGKLEFIGF